MKWISHSTSDARFWVRVLTDPPKNNITLINIVIFLFFLIVKYMKKILSLFFIILTFNIYSFKTNAASIYVTCIDDSYAHTFLLLIKTSEDVAWFNYRYDGFMVDDPNYDTLRINFIGKEIDMVNGVFIGDAYFDSGDDGDSAYVGQNLFSLPIKYEFDLSTSLLKLQSLATVETKELTIPCWDSD